MRVCSVEERDVARDMRVVVAAVILMSVILSITLNPIEAADARHAAGQSAATVARPDPASPLRTGKRSTASHTALVIGSEHTQAARSKVLIRN